MQAARPQIWISLKQLAQKHSAITTTPLGVAAREIMPYRKGKFMGIVRGSGCTGGEIKMPAQRLGHGSNSTPQQFMPGYLMTNTTMTSPAESTAASADADKALMDTIDTKDLQDGDLLVKGGERSTLVSGRSGTVSGLMSDDQGTA